MYLFSLRHHFPLPFFTYTIIERFPTMLQQLRKQRRETWSVTLASQSLPLSTTRLVPWPEISLGRNLDNGVCIDDSPLLPNFLASLRFGVAVVVVSHWRGPFFLFRWLLKSKRLKRKDKLQDLIRYMYTFLWHVPPLSVLHTWAGKTNPVLSIYDQLAE